MLRLNRKATSFFLPYPFKFIQETVLSVDVNLSRLYNFSDHSEFWNKPKQENLNLYTEIYCVVLRVLVICSLGTRGLPPASFYWKAHYTALWADSEYPGPALYSGNVGSLAGWEWEGFTAHHSSNKKCFP